MLKYFHSVGYIHGYVEPSTIGKFIGSNNWKMLDMRRATKMGKPMRGNIRYGAPPESVRISKEKGVIGEVKKMVSFDENFVRGDISKEKYEENETMAPLEFCPQKVVSDPTWDIWSFGLIMGQLVLGQSMVLMPNIEKATDAHLKNLHHYNDAAVNVSINGFFLVFRVFLFCSFLNCNTFVLFYRKFMMQLVVYLAMKQQLYLQSCCNLVQKIDHSLWMKY